MCSNRERASLLSFESSKNRTVTKTSSRVILSNWRALTSSILLGRVSDSSLVRKASTAYNDIITTKMTQKRATYSHLSKACLLVVKVSLEKDHFLVWPTEESQGGKYGDAMDPGQVYVVNFHHHHWACPFRVVVYCLKLVQHWITQLAMAGRIPAMKMYLLKASFRKLIM